MGWHELARRSLVGRVFGRAALNAPALDFVESDETLRPASAPPPGSWDSRADRQHNAARAERVIEAAG